MKSSCPVRVRLAVEGNLKALLARPMRLRQAQVPLPEMRRAVTARFQGFREGELGRLQVVLAFRLNHRAACRGRGGEKRVARGLRRLVTGGGGDSMTRAVLRGQDAGAGGRAKRASVGIREPHGTRGQALHVRRFIVLRSIRRGIHPAHVIDQEEDDVGRPVRSVKQPGEKEEERPHPPAKRA